MERFPCLKSSARQLTLWLGLVNAPGLSFPENGHRLETDIVQWTGPDYGVNSVKLRKPRKNLSGGKRYGTASRYHSKHNHVSTNFNWMLLLRILRYRSNIDYIEPEECFEIRVVDIIMVLLRINGL